MIVATAVAVSTRSCWQTVQSTTG